MSFGVSVGEVLAVGQFAWNVYKACKGAPSEFEEISREVSTLHTAIKELQDEVENEDSILNRAGNSKRKELEVLEPWDEPKRTQDRFRFDTKEVQETREKLTFHTSAIQLFLATLGTGSLGRIEKKLETIIGEIRSGRTESSILTTSGDDKADSEVHWDALKSELVEDGFLKDDLQSHRQWIKAHAQPLVDDGELQERFPAAKQRNPFPTTSPKRQRTTAQTSENQPPETKLDISRSDLKVKTSSSDSKGSTTSARTAIASDNKATRTPTIVTLSNETNRLDRNDAQKLRPPKSEARSSSPHRTEGSTQKDKKGLKTKDQSPQTMDRLSDPSKSKTSSSSPHRTDTSAQKDDKGSKAKGQSSRTVNPSNGLSESKTSSFSPYRTDTSAQKDNKVSKAKEKSSVIGDPLTEPRSPPREAKIVERPLHLTLEELFTGTLISDESVELKIKPGLRAGFKFKQEGVGEEGPQHIFFTVTEEPHDTFTRDKNNINSIVELDVEEAFTGWSRTVSTIDGGYGRVSGKGPTPPGHQVTIPGFGMPKSRSPEERGDFIVTFKVKFPSSLSKDERKSIEKALRVSASRSAI